MQCLSNLSEFLKLVCQTTKLYSECRYETNKIRASDYLSHVSFGGFLLVLRRTMVCVSISIGFHSNIRASAACLQVDHVKWFVQWITSFTILDCDGMRGVLIKLWKITSLNRKEMKYLMERFNLKGKVLRFSLKLTLRNLCKVFELKCDMLQFFACTSCDFHLLNALLYVKHARSKKHDKPLSTCPTSD